MVSGGGQEYYIELWVCYVEIDVMVVVYYVIYLVWFEVVCIELMYVFGLFYIEMEMCGYYLMFSGLYVQYCCVVCYDDCLDIIICIIEICSCIFKFVYEVYCIGVDGICELLVMGEIYYIVIDYQYCFFWMFDDVLVFFVGEG